jgi:hypothetical protein
MLQYQELTKKMHHTFRYPAYRESPTLRFRCEFLRGKIFPARKLQPLENGQTDFPNP